MKRLFRSKAALVGLLFTVAIWATWPSTRRPFQTVPVTLTGSATVPLLNVWTIWWNAEQLGSGWPAYWDAPILFPSQGALAFSEPQPSTWCVAPIVWLSGSPVLAYHIYMLLSLVLTGVFTWRLLRRCRLRPSACVTGAVAMQLHPLALGNLETIQLLPLWPTLWTLERALKLSQPGPRVRDALSFGLAVSSVFFCSVHHGLMLLIVLVPSLVWLIPERGRPRWLLNMGVGVLVAAALLAPLLGPMKSILDTHDFRRNPQTVRALSATASQWCAPGNLLGLRFSDQEARAPKPLNPGFVRCSLALLGCWLSLRSRRSRPWLLFWTSLCCFTFLLSLGPNLKIYQWQPWHTLTDLLPPLERVRSVYRFAYFTQLIVILLAAVCLDRLWTWSRQTWPSGWRNHASCVLLVALSLLVAVEVMPPKWRLAAVPDVRQSPPWVDFLREHTSPQDAIAFLPFARGYSERALEPTARQMLQATQQHASLLNGYSGFFPKSWYDHIEFFRTFQFDAQCHAYLQQLGCKFLVIDTSHPRLRASTNQKPTTGFRRVFSHGTLEIWQVEN